MLDSLLLRALVTFRSSTLAWLAHTQRTEGQCQKIVSPLLSRQNLRLESVREPRSTMGLSE